MLIWKKNQHWLSFINYIILLNSFARSIGVIYCTIAILYLVQNLEKKTFLSGGDKTPSRRSLPILSIQNVPECPIGEMIWLNHWHVHCILNVGLFIRGKWILIGRDHWSVFCFIAYTVQYGMLICNFHFNRPTNKVSCSCIIQYTLVCSCWI